MSDDSAKIIPFPGSNAPESSSTDDDIAATIEAMESTISQIKSGKIVVLAMVVIDDGGDASLMSLKTKFASPVALISAIGALDRAKYELHRLVDQVE